MSGQLAGVIGGVSGMIVFGFVIHTVLTAWRRNRQAKLQAEIQGRLLERFADAAELAEFLSGPAGERFLESATFERSRPHGRILGSIQAGIVITLTAIALLWLEGRWPHDEEGFLFLGAVGLAIGIGFLLSAGVSYALSKAWGLMNGRPERDEA